MPIIFVGEFLNFALTTGTEKVWIRGGGGGVSRYSVENFLFHSAYNFRRATFTFAVFSGTGKVWIRGGRSIKIFRRRNFVSRCRKFSLGILLLLEYFWVPEKFGKQGGGVSRFSFEKILSHSTENFRRVILPCCINFGYRKGLGKKGGVSRYSVEVFCFTVPNNFVGEPFSISLISGIEKFSTSEGYVTIFDFLSKVYCLTVPKKIAGDFFSAVFQKISGSEKIMDKRGGGVSRYSVENFLPHSAYNFRRGISKFCPNYGYRKSLDKRGGSIKIFRGKFFVSQCL